MEEDVHTVVHEMADAFEGAMNDEKEKWRLMFMCYDALIFLLEGNYNQALEKIQDLRTQHATSAIVHRCYAEILARSVNEPDLEDDELQRRRDEAIEEARTAVSLAPDDAEMARFLARMLLNQAKTRQEFEEVSRICETLLVILNPVAHGLERLEANSESVFPEDRIDMILIDLQILKANSTDRIKLLPPKEEKVREAEDEDPPSSEKQKSSTRASESSGGIFGTGEQTKEEKVREAEVEDPPSSEKQKSSTRASESSGEIFGTGEQTKEEKVREAEVEVPPSSEKQKSSTRASESSGEIFGTGEQTKEEKVREAEVEDPPSSEQQKSSARASESSGEIFGAGERTNIDRRRNLVRSYLNNMTVEEKKALLKVKISDLKIHFESLGADSKRLATDVLLDALKCADLTNNWTDIKCRDCGTKFVSAKPLIQHSLHVHIGNLILPEAKSLLPYKEWIEMLLDDPPSSSDRGSSDEIASCYLDACRTLDLLGVEERDYGGEERDFIIAFDSNSLFLVLDERKSPNGGDVEGFLSSLVDELEERGFPSTCEALRTWSNRFHKTEKPRALFTSLKKGLTLINLNLEKECEHLKYMKELLALAEQYSKESVHAEGDIGFSENYWGMIRKQRYGLFELGDKEAFARNRFKMKALSIVLKDAFSQDPDSEDRLPRAVFGRQMNKAQEELKKFSAELEPKLDHVEQLLYKELVPTSTVEYETILLTLLKSCMQKWLEDSAERKDFLKVFTASEAAKALRRQMKKKKGKKGKSSSHA